MLKFPRNKVARETIWSLLAKGIAFVMFFSMNVVLARKLGKIAYGQWSVFFSLFTIGLVLSSLGINAATRTYVALAGNPGKKAQVTFDGLWLRFGVSFFFSLVMWFGAPLVASAWGRPYLVELLRLGAPFLFFSGFLEFYKNLFMGLHRLKYDFLINAAEWGLRLVAVVVGLHLVVNSLPCAAAAHAIAAVLAAAVGGIAVYRLVFRGVERTGDSHALPIFKYGIPMVMLSIGFLATAELNTLMVSALSTDIQVSYFALAKDLTGKFPHLAIALAMGSGPLFATITNENREKIRRLFGRLVRLILGLSLAVGAVLAVGAPWFVPWVYGRQFAPAALPMQILAVQMVCQSLSAIASTFLDYQRLAWYRAMFLTVAIAANVGLNLWLIPRYGATGAALAQTVAYVPYVTLSLFAVAKRLRGPLPDGPVTN